jgi:hypothetical protein
MLGGCNAHVANIVQTGDDKFMMIASAGLVTGATVAEAVKQAQAFCRGKGFDYAEITDRRPREADFSCMRKGETISRQASSSITGGPITCIRLDRDISTCQ